MTRGAKKTEHHEEPDDAEPGTSADQQGAAAASKPDKLEELASLVKSLVRSQASRDQQMEKESTRQEQRWRSMQHQFLQIQTQVRELRGDHEDRAEHHDGDDDDDGEDLGVMASQQNEPPPPPRAPHVHRDAKLIPLSPDDDIEHYLTTFVRMATVCRWPKEEWAIQLVPLLTDFILHADAEDLKKPEISVQNSGSGGEVDLSCQTKLKHLPSGTNVICNLYIGDSSQPFRSTWTKHKDKVCIFIVKRDDLKQGLQSVGATEVSCDYSVPTDPRSPSPRSDKRKIEGLSPGTSTFSEADKKTTSPPAVTTKKSTETSVGLNL